MSNSDRTADDQRDDKRWELYLQSIRDFQIAWEQFRTESEERGRQLRKEVNSAIMSLAHEVNELRAGVAAFRRDVDSFRQEVTELRVEIKEFGPERKRVARRNFIRGLVVAVVIVLLILNVLLSINARLVILPGG